MGFAMTGREELIRDAFDAFARGDVEPLKRLFDPGLRWIGIPRGDDTPSCPNRGAALDLLSRHRANGRCFTLGTIFGEGDRVAVAVTVTDPAWSAPVETFKVFTFRAGEDIVVQLNDCIDESYARQILAA